MRTLIVCLLMFLALPAFAHDETDTLHRYDEGGPTADVECSGTTATATWHLPQGATYEHPDLNTGGYVYFTPEQNFDTIEDETRATMGGLNASHDFGVTEFAGEVTEEIHVEVIPGEAYRAHLLVAYVDGPAWHNDTQFVCPEIIDADVLPFTGLPTLLLAVVGALFGIVGYSIVAVAGRSDDRNEVPRG